MGSLHWVLEVVLSIDGLGVPAPVAPWSSLDGIADHILCLFAMSLTHIENIELSGWLVVLVEGKERNTFGAIIG